VYNHRLLRRLSRALSAAVQLLLPQRKQKAASARKQERAAGVVALLQRSLSVFLPAWVASTTPQQEDDDLQQIGQQVAESAVLKPCASPPFELLHEWMRSGSRAKVG
jgi:hypothetical protein